MADDTLDIDLTDLKVREIEELEEITGLPFDECFVTGGMKGKTIRALGYIVKKRDNPDFTLEEAGELRIVLTSNEDPTTAAT